MLESDIEVPSSLNVSSCFFYWKDIYPELQILIDNFDIILKEIQHVNKVNNCIMFFTFIYIMISC